MKNILIIIFIVCTTVYSQNIKIGFNLNVHQVRINQWDGILGGDGLPMSIHLIAGYNITKDISVKAEIGRTFHLQFLGWEYGIKGDYYIYHPFYISAGVLLHSNEAEDLGMGEHADYASIFMLQAGIGVNIISSISAELNYFYPTSKKIIEDSSILYGSQKYLSTTFEGMIRLGFVFSWNL